MDYEIFTKVLNNRLTQVIDGLVHKDQAGFIPGRSIFDPIKQSKLLISYTETKEENRLIIALDQEKAYDKISHKYLWETLRRFGIPGRFTDTIASLYSTATTVVIIIGVISPPYRVIRG
jgi:hypothetical protein